ncbi:DUF4251 domain-containing protein [Flavobacterium sp. GA093]|uniref:DUF4251 domain-containing protein n=1 Tax=Flavobacterium hydrocarbonoxydans TaxID=2683249 RepID=A0A6I4NWS4_9FLAO|nr:DUF4251 domain-containing protein [Flavobacterium hydrocarbonoxydans]MWB96149.1 DUF4251 domain-containing protein [Flavobacterium hydrocarbonoxydans]
MKTKWSILLVLVCFLNFQGYAQEKKSKKELKAEAKLNKEKEIAALIDAKNFVFDAERVMPQGYRTINIDYNTYFLKFTEEKVEADLPFFGRAFNVAYGSSDGGMKFEGKPEDIIIEKKKKYYEIKATVKGKEDVYSILMSVYFEGGTTLTINSNKRASISYDGNSRAPKTDAVK